MEDFLTPFLSGTSFVCALILLASIHSKRKHARNEAAASKPPNLGQLFLTDSCWVGLLYERPENGDVKEACWMYYERKLMHFSSIVGDQIFNEFPLLWSLSPRASDRPDIVGFALYKNWKGGKPVLHNIFNPSEINNPDIDGTYILIPRHGLNFTIDMENFNREVPNYNGERLCDLAACGGRC